MKFASIKAIVLENNPKQNTLQIYFLKNSFLKGIFKISMAIYNAKLYNANLKTSVKNHMIGAHEKILLISSNIITPQAYKIDFQPFSQTFQNHAD